MNSPQFTSFTVSGWIRPALTIALLALLAASCSSTKPAASAAKPDKKDLKGTWEVTNIRFIGNEGLYKADLLDVADSRCFKGSEWVFIPNNNTGRFSLPAAGRCTAQTHRILWSFFESGEGTYDFQYKYVDERNRPIAASRSGYRMQITRLARPDMELRIQTVDEEGAPFQVVLTFTRVSDDIAL